MIPFNFEYYKPDTVEEAVGIYDSLVSANKKVVYYGGGTEFISMARMNNIYADAVIDTKGIEECNVYELTDGILTIGSAVTLTRIADINLFPLLSLAVKRIADQTIQNKITLGGNIAGSIIYRESVLPLLVSNCEILLASKNGVRFIPINNVFNKRINLNSGEMIVKVKINQEFLTMPYLHVKRTKNEKIDYPLITLVALLKDEKIDIAFSGLCDFPFRSIAINEIINDRKISLKEKLLNIIDILPGKMLSDLSGSTEYREFMLGNMIEEVLDKFEEEV